MTAGLLPALRLRLATGLLQLPASGDPRPKAKGLQAATGAGRFILTDLPAQALPFCDRRSQLEVARHAISALLHVRAAGPVAWRSRADLVFLRYRVQGDLLPPTHAHGKLVAAGQSLKPGTIRAGSRVSLTFRQAQMPKHRVRRGPCSEPSAEVRAWHGREHLLLVVDRPAAVGDPIERGGGGDKQRVELAAGTRQAQVSPYAPHPPSLAPPHTL